MPIEYRGYELIGESREAILTFDCMQLKDDGPPTPLITLCTTPAGWTLKEDPDADLVVMTTILLHPEEAVAFADAVIAAVKRAGGA